MPAHLTLHQKNECKRVAGGKRYSVTKHTSTGTYVHIVKSSSADVYFVPFEGDAEFRRTLVTDWDQRFLDLAAHVATWSKDPSTQVGCVIVRPDRTVASLGYNGFPRGVHDSRSRLTDRAVKLAFAVHAEPNAIAAAREPLYGYTCYVYPFPPCSNCAGLLVQSGIARVVAPQPTPAQVGRWGPSFSYMETIFYESGVELDVLNYARPEER